MVRPLSKPPSGVISAELGVDRSNPRPGLKAAFDRGEYGGMVEGAQYRRQFWVLSPEERRFAMSGIHGQSAYFDLERDLMIVTYGSYPIASDLILFRSLESPWSGITRGLS